MRVAEKDEQKSACILQDETRIQLTGMTDPKMRAHCVVKTNAVRVLDRLGIKFELREYEVDPDDLSAQTVAAKIGIPPDQLFKTQRNLFSGNSRE
jgi:hypothetical protein